MGFASRALPGKQLIHNLVAIIPPFHLKLSCLPTLPILVSVMFALASQILV